MLVLWTALGSLAAGTVFLFAFRGILQGEGFQRTNYRGVRLSTGAGIIFVPSFLVVWIVSEVYYTAARVTWGQMAQPGYFGLGSGMNVMLVLVLGMSFVGLLDDVAGDEGARGFKGHFSEALKGRFTTGFMKAVMGFMVALAALLPVFIIVDRMSYQHYGELILAAAVIALCANLFNLFDLAPGRALKLFFPALGLCVGLTLRHEVIGEAVPWGSLAFYVIPAMAVAAVALVLFYGDLRERFMMGDAGSNVIGAVIGLGLVLGTSFWWRVGVLVLLLVLNLLSEKLSFSSVIASNRVLSWLDSLGREGESEP